MRRSPSPLAWRPDFPGAPRLALHVGFLRMSGRPLSSVRVLPQELLRHLGAVLKVEVPDIASLRSLYKADRTLSHHQQVAADLLGFFRMTEHQRRALVRYLRTQVAIEFNRDHLILNAKEWLYGNKLIIEHDRSLRSIIDTEVRTHEAKLAQTIREIGRASCRERVEISVVAVSL